VVNVTGVVRNVWKIRETATFVNNLNTATEGDDATLFTDDGPLAKDSQHVFSLSMYSFRGDSSQRRESPTEVMLYFYNEWAEKCAFLSSGDILTLSGRARMVGD
jgi:hypothetical protein